MKLLSADPRFAFETSEGSENDQKILREIFVENVYRVEDSDLPEQGGVVVDLGANFGAFTTYCHGLHPETAIYAYEPEPHNFELLKVNLKANAVKNVIAVQQAVGDERGTDYIINGGGGSRLVRYIPREEVFTDAAKVEIVTLADVWDAHHLQEVDVLKLDVEGAETDIIAAAPLTLLAQVRYVTLEYDAGGRRMGRLVEKLSETHAVQILGSYLRGAYIYARRY